MRQNILKHIVEDAIFLPLSRGRAATRAILWAVPTLLLGAAAFVVYSRLHFVPTAVSNRIVDYAVAVAALPLPVVCVICAIRTVRYLLVVVWPSSLGVYARTPALELRLGPFGTIVYPGRELIIRYPFELSGDEENGGFEAFLPEEEQLARLLPRITHPQAKKPIHRTILHFIAGGESDIARALRPAIELWRIRSQQRNQADDPFSLTPFL